MISERGLFFSCLLGAVTLCVLAASVSAQQPPRLRKHTATVAGEAVFQPANVAPITANEVTVTIEGSKRVITANGISKHKTGQFPGLGNPNKISEQNIRISLPLRPRKNSGPKYYQLGDFGIGLNGIFFDPQAAEWYLGQRGSKWQYDALGGALPLGFDAHWAHVQPNGKYHYHGIPNGLLTNLSFRKESHSPLVGWATDGFPIFAIFGQDKSGQIRELKPSYRLRAGKRPGGTNEPGGKYDGAFVADWEYVSGLGDLDACNGTLVKTRDFPNGTYAYFLTNSFPVIPRCHFGEAVSTQDRRQGGNGTGQRRGRPDLGAAANRLGISKNELRRALGPPPPNFSRAAQKLGLSEEQLRNALHSR